jgi:hypothetical protein
MPQSPKIQPQPERKLERAGVDTRASQQSTPTSWAGSTRMTPEARAYRGKGWA